MVSSGSGCGESVGDGRPVVGVGGWSGGLSTRSRGFVSVDRRSTSGRGVEAIGGCAGDLRSTRGDGGDVGSCNQVLRSTLGAEAMWTVGMVGCRRVWRGGCQMGWCPSPVVRSGHCAVFGRVA